MWLQPDWSDIPRLWEAGHVRPVPFEHAPVIKVQYNNDNNWQSFVFYYCILHK